MKKKILADFQICISALLKKNLKAIKGIGIIKKLSNVLQENISLLFINLL